MGGAILVSVVEMGGTAFAIFVLILFHGPGLSYPLRATEGWGRREATTALALFCLLLGFFTGKGSLF